MPRYHQLGEIPHKRHVTFKKKDGSLYQEELFGTILEKDGNRVKLDFIVPKKYNLGNLTRLYRLVTDPI